MHRSMLGQFPRLGCYILWQHLIIFHDRIQGPWLMLGGFNEITIPSEQRGGILIKIELGRF